MAAAELDPNHQCKGITDQLTDEEKKIPNAKLTGYIIETAKSCLDSLSQIHDNVVACKKTKDSVDTVEVGLNNLIKMFKLMMRLTKQDTDGIIPTTEICKESILNIFKNGYKKECNDVIWKTVKKAYNAATVLQFVQLYRTWKAISAASNVIESEDEYNCKFKKINEKIQKMQSIVIEFVEICETQPEDTRIPVMMSDIKRLYNFMISKVNDIRVRINGHIQQLNFTSKSAALNSVHNAVIAVGEGYQLWTIFENLSLHTKWLGIMSVGLRSIFGICKAAEFLISENKLKELQKDLKNANYLKETLDDLFEEVEWASYCTFNKLLS